MMKGMQTPKAKVAVSMSADLVAALRAAVADGRARSVSAYVEHAVRAQLAAVPAGCVAQAWRNPARQARTAVLLRQPHVEIASLDDADARRVGLLLASTSTSDVVDGHVALCAHRSGRPVLTSDPDAIRRLAPSVRLHRV